MTNSAAPVSSLAPGITVATTSPALPVTVLSWVKPSPRRPARSTDFDDFARQVPSEGIVILSDPAPTPGIPIPERGCKPSAARSHAGCDSG